MSTDQEVTVCEIGGGCRAITERLERGVTAIAWSRDGARVFYLQRTNQAGWGELKSMSVDGPQADDPWLVRSATTSRDVHRNVSPRRNRLRAVHRGAARALEWNCVDCTIRVCPSLQSVNTSPEYRAPSAPATRLAARRTTCLEVWTARCIGRPIRTETRRRDQSAVGRDALGCLAELDGCSASRSSRDPLTDV